jgi:uncharacterized membrane protein YraQ (UPF0718 family)
LSSVHRSGQWTSSINGLVAASSTLGSSWYYFGKIVIALVLAIVLAAGVEAFAVPLLARKLGRAGATLRGQVLAAVSGAPLMLCSCCITPVFGAVQRSGVTLRNALTLMLASPTMNPAALLLTVMLFPGRVALARFVGAAVIVFALPRLAEKLEGDATAARSTIGLRDGYRPGPTDAGIARRYLSSLWNVVAHAPILVPGILLSSLLIQRHGDLGAVQSSDALAFAALGITLIALPTYFEIPLALLAMHAGGSGLAAAVLIAGPAVNLPSLLTLWRQVSARTAVVIGFGVCVSATLIAFVVRG